MRTRASTPVSGISPRRGHVNHGIELGVAGETQRAVPGQVELPALELIGAAHGVDGAGQRQRPASGLADVEIAAERDVHVAERALASARPAAACGREATRLSGMRTCTSSSTFVERAGGARAPERRRLTAAAGAAAPDTP